MPAASVTSPHVGVDVPHLNVSRGCASVGTIIKNRSTHIPATTNAEAMTVPRIVLNLLNASNTIGMKKQQATIAQNNGANEPLIFERKTAISEGSLPYHVVRYSANVK